MKRTNLILALIVALAVIAPAKATNLDVKRVPANALWVVHVDFNAMINSNIGKLILKDLEAVGLKEHIAKVKAEIGLDPLMDFNCMTIYGTGYEPADAVAIVEMGPTTGKLDEMVRKADSYELHDHNGIPIHSWIEKHHRQVRKYCGVLKSQKQDMHLLIFSESKQKVIESLNHITKAGKDLGMTDLDALKSRPGDGSFFFLAGVVTQDLAKKKPGQMMLQMTKSIVIDCGESQGKIYSKTTLTVVNAEKASMMYQMGQGLLAMAQMEPAEGPLPRTRLAKATKLALSGNTITATFSYDSAAMHQELKTMHENKCKRNEEGQKL